MGILLKKPIFLWTIAGILFPTAIGVGVDLMLEGYTWLGIGILIGGVLIAYSITHYGYLQYKRHRPHSRRNTKVITTLWGMYKLVQRIVEKVGSEGLEGQKLYEVKVIAQKGLRVPSIQYHKPLNDEEASKLMHYTNKRMKTKMKKEVTLDKKTLQKLWILGNILDRCGIGANASLKGNKRYKFMKDKLGKERIVTPIDSIEVKRCIDLSFTLNSTFLSFLYFAPIYEQALPINVIPAELFKDALDEIMLDHLNRIGGK